MAGFNQVILLGNLTRDPEVRYTSGGTPVGSFGIATNRRFTQNGDVKEEVMFIDVVSFGKTAENNAKYLTKGSRVHIEGRLQQRRWEDQGGGKHSKHEVVANQVLYLSKSTQPASTDDDPGYTPEG